MRSPRHPTNSSEATYGKESMELPGGKNNHVIVHHLQLPGVLNHQVLSAVTG